MSRRLLWLLLGSAVVAYLFMQRQKIATIASDAGDFIVTTLTGWKNAGSGPRWTGYLAATERLYNLPADLLARVAYQESHFREDIIRGTTTSSAGALGIMQLMPQFFSSVTVPRPYTDADVAKQIDEAAAQLASLYQSTKSWKLALAAYNAGLGRVQQYGGIPPFPETQNYVAQISADVPALSA